MHQVSWEQFLLSAVIGFTLQVWVQAKTVCHSRCWTRVSAVGVEIYFSAPLCSTTAKLIFPSALLQCIGTFIRDCFLYSFAFTDFLHYLLYVGWQDTYILIFDCLYDLNNLLLSPLLVCRWCLEVCIFPASLHSHHSWPTQRNGFFHTYIFFASFLLLPHTSSCNVLDFATPAVSH